MVVEFVQLRYPGQRWMFNVRLGPVPLAIAKMYPGVDVDRIARLWKKTCDAIVITDRELVLIESEIIRPIEAIGELLVYRDLIPQTDDLRAWWTWPVRLVLVSPQKDPTLDATTRAHNIEVVYYRPAWVEAYVKEVLR